MRTLIIDSYEICRSGIRCILDETFENCVVCEADNVDVAVNCLTGHGADLIIWAITDLDENETRKIPSFLQNVGDVPVIAISKTHSRVLREYLKYPQFKGIINRNDKREIVVAAIRLVLAGGQYFPPEMYAPATFEPDLQGVGDPSGYSNLGRLTRRQREVLKAISQGKSNKSIAEELGISPGTVKVHVSNLMKDLNAKNRTQAVAIANNLEML